MAKSLLDKCVEALLDAGCDVGFTNDRRRVRVLFPSGPNDLAPDGVERTFDATTFTFVCTRALLSLAEGLGVEPEEVN